MNTAAKVICEAERKEGESIHVAIAHLNAQGVVISDEGWSSYGFENVDANEVHTLIIETLNDLTRKLNEMQNPGHVEKMEMFRKAAKMIADRD